MTRFPQGFGCFLRIKKLLGRTETRTRDRMYRQSYEQLETSPEAIEQELRPEVCEQRQTDRLMENYSIDNCRTLPETGKFSLDGLTPAWMAGKQVKVTKKTKKTPNSCSQHCGRARKQLQRSYSKAGQGDEEDKEDPK